MKPNQADSQDWIHLYYFIGTQRAKFNRARKKPEGRHQATAPVPISSVILAEANRIARKQPHPRLPTLRR
jgi:hypothetical protein